MRYFQYSPVDMHESEAFAFAFMWLKPEHVAKVDARGRVQLLPLSPGTRPVADDNTYLVRVEADDSTRLVSSKLL